MANTIGEKELKTDWDATENFKKEINMIPEEGSLVPRIEKEGL